MTSGGGTGASQAFSEVGMDVRRDRAALALHGAAKASGADDSGSSHASEPPVRQSNAHQECTLPHVVPQDVVQALNVSTGSPCQHTAPAGVTQAATCAPSRPCDAHAMSPPSAEHCSASDSQACPPHEPAPLCASVGIPHMPTCCTLRQ